MKEQLLSTRGRIFNIQRFSIHDGAGVRTIVFLKGCPLRCRWCCNPEGQEYKIEEMTQNGVTKTVGRDVTVAEVLAEVERDRIYYRRSGGGGLTLSGGECLAQPDFAAALLEAAHEKGITTAIETTGYAPIETVRRLLPFVDEVLMDIKHLDGEKHKTFTGRDNALILENARHIAREAKRLVVRVPVIPTFNASAGEIGAIAAFAREIGAQEIHLLPYHRIGSDKYGGLGRTYEMGNILPPDKETMQALLAAAAATGMRAQIGG